MKSGIAFFDTAPAYGDSEILLGEMCGSLDAAEREHIQIATKVGEHWVAKDQSTVVDHSREAVRRSVEQSLRRLGRIDVLQIHKAGARLLRSDAFPAVIEALDDYNIPALGVSVGDMDTFELARATNKFLYYQFPFNQASTGLGGILDALAHDNAQPLVNRPLAMGALIRGSSSADRSRALRDAFGFIFPRMHSGVILTGTGNSAHLRENLRALGQMSQAR